MNQSRTFRATVRAGRGKATGVMSSPQAVEMSRKLTGLSVIEGTLNITLELPLDPESLNFFNFSSVGVKLDLKSMGIDFEGEQGFYYRRVTVAGKYPAALLLFTWRDLLNAELISPHHLRSTLGLEDGDTLQFTID